MFRSRDSSVGIATGFDSRQRQDFSQHHDVQTYSGAHQISYPIDIGKGDISPGVNRPGREADQSLISSTEVKNGGAIPPLPMSS
jgi:hypothetical protein